MPKKPNKKAAEAEDLEATLAVTPSAEQRAQVEAMVKDGIVLAQRIERGEELMKELKAQLHELNSKRFPDLLGSLGTTVFAIDKGEYEGWSVELAPYLSGSLPDADKDPTACAKAFAYLRANGAEDLIKSQMHVEFERGEDNIAGDVKAALEKHGLDYEFKEGVHNATMRSCINERLKKGEKVDLEILGYNIGRQAKVKPPKVKKEKAK